jgi:hypothetical protein
VSPAQAAFRTRCRVLSQAEEETVANHFEYARDDEIVWQIHTPFTVADLLKFAEKLKECNAPKTEVLDHLYDPDTGALTTLSVAWCREHPVGRPKAARSVRHIVDTGFDGG